MKNSTNAMPESHQGGSISRTLLSPHEHHLGIGTLGTFRLRYILAEDGCKESQVALAKSLLTVPSKNFEERSFNAQLAVYWLLQAAKKGQEEAFALLRECVNAGIGINAINNSDIDKCLNFTEEEKVARRIAFSFFRRIMSDTEDLVPEDIFREKVDVILKEENREKLSTKAMEDPPLQPQQPSQKRSDEASLRNQAHVSFSEVVNSVQSCLEGNVPLVSLKQVTHYSEYKRWLSTKYIRIMWDLILRSTENLFQKLSSFVFPLSFLLLCLLLQLAYALSPSGNEISNFIKESMLKSVTLFCLVSMVSSTCFIIYINFGGDNVKKWLHLIKFFEPNIKSDEVERKFLSKTTFPLITFFFISLMYMTLAPLSSLVSFADIGVLSFVLMLFVDRTITHQRYYVNISFTLNALTSLYKANILQNFFTNSLAFLNFNITYEVIENLYVHLSLISCLALPFVLPYLYVKMALGKQRGWHLVLLPHLMSLVWMNLACIHLANTTTTYQFFSVFSWLVILILSNYIGTVPTFIMYLLLKVYSFDFKIEILFLFIAFIVVYFVSLLFVKKFKASNETKLWPSVICFAALVLSYQAVKPEIQKPETASSSVLPWEKYQTYCHHHAWYRTNTAEVQISCLPLKGKEISLEGTVTSIDVILVKNYMQLVANIMPQPLQGWFACIFGKNYQNCDSESLSQFEKERCKFYQTFNLNQCHLHNWNEYKYQMVLEVSSRTSPEVVLLADDVCSEFVTNLKEGDSLHVIGALESNIGSSLPRLIVRQAQCTSCYVDAVCNTFSTLPSLDYRLSLKNIIKLYFEPFVQYEPK